MRFLNNFKYRFIKNIENFPIIQIFIYNNLEKFKFLFPHDKDYLALNILFKPNEKRDFIDVGGNIGLSFIGFREIGFKSNKILVFEPDNFLVSKYLIKLKKIYKKIHIFNFGLSNNNSKKKLFKAFYKKKFFHFNNSFDKKYILNKIKHNYPDIYDQFEIKSQTLILKKFDNLNLITNACFIKIDVEGFDHKVIEGMWSFIKLHKPVLLIEYNESNFKKIYDKINKFYFCYQYDTDKNKLLKLSESKIKMLKSGKILEKRYVKNSVNIFYINKKRII